MPSRRKKRERFASQPLVKKVSSELRYISNPKDNHNKPNRRGKKNNSRRTVSTIEGV